MKLSRARMRPKASCGDVIAAQRIPGVHGAQNGEIGIGIEALDESLALVIEVAGNVESPADQAAAMSHSHAQGSSPLRLGLRPKRSSKSGADL